MPDIWVFGEPKNTTEIYMDGTVVPHRSQTVSLNGKLVGEIEIHLHKRHGADGVTDLSYGATAVAYGPLPGGS